MNEEITKATDALALRAQGLRVVDQESANRAAEIILLGKAAIKKIKDFFAPLKRAQDEAKQKLISAERSELIKVEPIVSTASAALAAWRLAEEVKRREAEMERRRQEEERRRLEEEVVRKAQEAERRAAEEKRRIEEESRRRELEAQRNAEEAKTAAARRKAEENARIARDEAARRRAEADRRAREEQDRILAQAAAEEAKLEPVVVVPAAPVSNGMALRDNWTFEVFDPGAVPRDYLMIDEVKIGKIARAAKGRIQIPGVRIFSKPSMVKTK